MGRYCGRVAARESGNSADCYTVATMKDGKVEALEGSIHLLAQDTHVDDNLPINANLRQ